MEYTIADDETITKNSSAKMMQNRNKQEIMKYLTMAAIPRMEVSKMMNKFNVFFGTNSFD